MKVHTPGLYQKMFVHQQALDPDASFTPIYLPLPNKVTAQQLPNQVVPWPEPSLPD
jgi:hypothetical protein